jgi:hypothetical protein
MSTTTMARANNISNADELRAEIRAMIVPDWVSIAAIAFSIPVAPAQLSRWLEGNAIEADLKRFEREIGKFLKLRAAWLAEVNSVDPERRRGMRLAKAVEVRELGAKLAEEPSRSAYGDVLQECIAFGVYDLFLLSEEGEAASCYRCGAPRPSTAPKTTVEEQIELNLRTAVWRGFKTEESFRERMRAVMSDGEYITHIHGGVVWVRRPDRSVYVSLPSGVLEAAR